MKSSKAFSVIIRYSFSNKYLHFILILLEYSLLFLPSTLKSTRISLYLFNLSELSTSEYYDSSTIIKLFNKFKISLDSRLPLSITIATIILLMANYYCFFFQLDHIRSKDKSTQCYVIGCKIIVNLYDIIFFRYFSFIFIDNIIFMILKAVYESTLTNSIVAIILFVLLSIYLFTIMTYIYNYAVMFSINNNQLCINFPKYAFNLSTIETDIYLLLLKLFISLENNFSHLIPFTLFSVTSLANIICVLLYIILPIKVLLFHYLFEFNTLKPWINLEIIMFRYFLLLFHLLLTLSILFFSNQLSYKPLQMEEQIFYFFASFIASFLITFYLNKSLNSEIINGNISANKLLFLIAQDTQEMSANNQFLSKIYSNMVSYHFLKCTRICSFCQFHSSPKNEEENITCKPFYTYTHSITHYIVKITKLTKKNREHNCLVMDSHLNDILMDILYLFYYRIKHKIFDFFSYYSSFKRKYGKHILLINNMELFINCCLEEEGGMKSDKIFFKEIFSFFEMNQMIYDVLTPLLTYISSNNQKNTSDQLVSLSYKLNQIRNKVLSVLVKVEKQENPSQDYLKKTIRNALSYELTISQFIMESLLNESYNQITPLNIDMLEEYFTHHFNNDKLLIMTVSFSDKIKELIECKIIKFTGSIYKKENEMLSDYFPHFIKQEGNELFKKMLFEYKHKNKRKDNRVNYAITNNDLESKGTFRFIMQNSYYLDYFYYEYYLSPQIQNLTHYLLLYGFYSIEYTSIILLEQEEDNNKNKVVGFSKSIKDVICFRAKWLSILSNNKMKIYLEDIFSKVRLISNQKGECATKDNNIEYECEISYVKYKLKIMEYYNYLQELNEIKRQDKEMKSISKAIQSIDEKCHLSLQYKLKLLFRISSTQAVFCLIKRDQETILKEQFSNIHQTIQFSLNQYRTVNLSSSSCQERSGSKFTSHLIKYEEDKKRIKDQKECKVKKKKKQLYSILTIMLSLSLIVLCLIFLIAEISITKQLQQITNVFIQYKTIKMAFASLYISFSSSLCYTFSRNSQTCTNSIKRYSKVYHEYGLPPELSFEEYLLFEIQNKTVFLQTLLLKLKNLIYMLNEDDILGILSSRMNYSSLDSYIIGNSLKQVETELTFEEGFRIYLNNYAIIANENYLDIPYYIISLEEEYRFNLEHLIYQKREIENVELKIYEIIMNYLSLESLLRSHQTTILNKFTFLQQQNINYLIIFMIIAFILALLLDFLSRRNILIGYQLFREIITQINTKIYCPQSKAYIENKLSDLITLSCCYINDPNVIISKIRDKEIKHHTDSIIKLKAQNQTNTPDTSKKNLIEIGSRLEAEPYFRKRNTKKDKIYNTIISPFLNVNLYFFLAYFITIIIIDIVLIIDFNQLFQTFDYILWNCHMENWLYNDIIYTQMIFQINTTEGILKPFINHKSEGDDLITSLLRISFGYHRNIINYQSKDPDKYTPLSSFFEYDCDKVMQKIADPYFAQLEKTTNKTYSVFPAFICKHFNLLHLEGFEFIYRDILTRIQSLFYQYKGNNTYSHLAKFSTAEETIDIYIMELFFVKPLRRYYTIYILTPLIESEFTVYKVFVIIYLVINSLLECIIFLVIKKLIVDKLTRIQENLFMLKKCF